MMQGILSGLIIIAVSLSLHIRIKQKLSNDEIADFEKRIKPGFLSIYYLAILPAIFDFLLRTQYNEAIIPSPIIIGLTLVIDLIALFTVYKALKNSSTSARELFYTMTGLTTGQFILLSTLTLIQ